MACIVVSIKTSMESRACRGVPSFGAMSLKSRDSSHVFLLRALLCAGLLCAGTQSRSFAGASKNKVITLHLWVLKTGTQAPKENQQQQQPHTKTLKSLESQNWYGTGTTCASKAVLTFGRPENTPFQNHGVEHVCARHKLHTAWPHKDRHEQRRQSHVNEEAYSARGRRLAKFAAPAS